MKYAEYLIRKLASEERYTHCYFVAGGNNMHLLDAARKVFKCIPVVNEVAAGIAAEYFNESNSDGNKAFALVTAGPGLTNIITAIAGAYLESRELLVIGGQVKRSDLKSTELRQRGIQEIDGRAIAGPITVASQTILNQLPFSKIQEILYTSTRPGPVFLEIPLDVQGSEFVEDAQENVFKKDFQINTSPFDVRFSVNQEFSLKSQIVSFTKTGFSRTKTRTSFVHEDFRYDCTIVNENNEGINKTKYELEIELLVNKNTLSWEPCYINDFLECKIYDLINIVEPIPREKFKLNLI